MHTVRVYPALRAHYMLNENTITQAAGGFVIYLYTPSLLEDEKRV